MLWKTTWGKKNICTGNFDKIKTASSPPGRRPMCCCPSRTKPPIGWPSGLYVTLWLTAGESEKRWERYYIKNNDQTMIYLHQNSMQVSQHCTSLSQLEWQRFPRSSLVHFPLFGCISQFVFRKHALHRAAASPALFDWSIMGCTIRLLALINLKGKKERKDLNKQQ